MSLTRARHHLILVGKKSTLDKSIYIKPMIQLSFKNPKAFLPNAAAFATHMQQLQLNPKLCEPANGDIDANVSLRNLARDMQPNNATIPIKARTAHNVTTTESSDPTNDGDGDFLSDSPVDSAGVADGDDAEDVPLQSRGRSKKRRRPIADPDDLDGLSPYARQHLFDADPLDDGEVDLDEAGVDGPIDGVDSIHSILARSAASHHERRIAFEQNIRQRTEDDELEMQLDPPTNAGNTEATSPSHTQPDTDDNIHEPNRATSPTDSESIESRHPPSHTSQPPSSFSSMDFDDEFSLAATMHVPPRPQQPSRREDVQVKSKRRKQEQTTDQEEDGAIDHE